MPNIVTAVVSQVQAPTPATLQQSGALISQGATVLTPQTYTLLTQLADLTPFLTGAKAISAISWLTGSANVTTVAPHGFTIGDEINLTIAGASPSGYNGTFTCVPSGASTFSYFLSSNPGANTTPGSYTPEDVAELVAMATSFFSQGSRLSISVLELGAGNPADGVVGLNTYITNNPNFTYRPGQQGFFYAYLVPAEWSDEPTYIAMLANYLALDAKTYFFTTATLQNYTSFTPLMKDVMTLIEAPQLAVYPVNPLTSIVYDGLSVPLGVDVVVQQSGGGSYAPGQVLTVVGSVGDPPTFTINTTAAVSATVAVGGSGGTPGAVTVTGTTGTGVKFQFAGTISGGGALTGPLTLVVPGAYTANPSVLTAEPVTGGALTGAQVNVIMGARTVVVLSTGGVSVEPTNPAATTVSPSGGTGCTLNIGWDTIEGVIHAVTTTAHGVNPGDWFQLQGNTPTGYNGYYQANATTGGVDLFAPLIANPGANTVLGSLVGNTVQSAGAPATEFTMAQPFWVALSYLPSSTNKVPPFAFSFLNGATPWPQRGTNPILTTLKTASVNTAQVASEGGLNSDVAIFWGTTMDGRDWTYWYSVDYASINSQIALANTVINGSNNPVNPLYYNQQGINRLQDAVVAVMQNCVAVGLANGTVIRSKLTAADFINAIDAGQFADQIVVNAEPLIAYLTENPNDYKAGRYAGIAVQYIPNRGFVQILFNLEVTDFLAP